MENKREVMELRLRNELSDCYADSKMLLTGGSGLLGQEIQKMLPCYAPDHKKLDITKPMQRLEGVRMVLHAAAGTDLVDFETPQGMEKCLETNWKGTERLAQTYSGVPFVYISSEYVRYPQLNVYAMSKLLGEMAVMENCQRWLIIRTLFKPRPFPYPKAFVDQYTMGDYVDVIAPMIVKEIGDWDTLMCKIVYIGTGRKTMFELAKQTRDVSPMSVYDVKGVVLPRDYL